MNAVISPFFMSTDFPQNGVFVQESLLSFNAHTISHMGSPFERMFVKRFHYALIAPHFQANFFTKPNRIFEAISVAKSNFISFALHDRQISFASFFMLFVGIRELLNAFRVDFFCRIQGAKRCDFVAAASFPAKL